MGSIAPSSLQAAPQTQFLFPPRLPLASQQKQLTARLANLRSQRLMLLREWTVGSPEVRAVEREILSTQRQLERLRLLKSPQILPPATQPHFRLLT